MCLGGRLHGRICPPPCGPALGIIPPNVVRGKAIEVPLTGAAARVVVRDFVAEITILQRYENNEQQPIEAVYEFPLERNSAVCGFFAQIDEQRIDGICKEKEEAKDIYDDAIASGHGAYLLEQSEKPNKFTASIGNLPPGTNINRQEKKVESRKTNQ
jgi:Ca-activated chloride channel family protein